MKSISGAFRELRWTLSVIMLFNAFLDTLLFFAIILLIITFIGSLHWYYAFYITLPFFILHTRTNLRKVSYKRVEEKVPSLKEALRTSADYIGRENEVVRQLHKEVLRKMRQIKSSYFLGIGRSFRRLVLLTGVCYAVILVSVFNFHLADLRESTDKYVNLDPLKDYAYQLEDLVMGEEDIFGEPVPVQLGTEDLNLAAFHKGYEYGRNMKN